MPFIHIRALPLPDPFEPGRAARAISGEFASATGTDEQHVTVTWQTIEPEHYSHAGETATVQDSHSHPILVELVAPDIHPAKRIEDMLAAAALGVARAAGVPPENVFAEFRAARSGQVLDGGRIVRW